MNKSGFIQRLANYILENHADKTDRLRVVFPNKRAAIFLKKELAVQAGKAIWMPRIGSVEETFCSWSGYQPADPLSIVFDLIEIYLKEHSIENNYFEQFAGYAAQIANDFDEIDHYLVDPEDIFNYLSEAKALELWHTDGSDLTSFEKNYIQFFKSLKSIYAALYTKMDQKQQAYSGAIARKLAEMPENELLAKPQEQFIIFAGFNALSPAEEAIYNILYKNKKAILLWDLDKYYVEPNLFGLHEASLSVRNFLKKHQGHPLLWTNDLLLTEPKIIRFIGVPGQTGQAKAMGYYLSLEADQKKETGKTAIVLSDEKLLFPVLNSIPESIGSFNVTMGIPFNISQLYTLMLLNFELENSFIERNNHHIIPLDKLIDIIHHEVIMAFQDEASLQKMQQLAKAIRADGNTYVTLDRFKALSAGLDPSLKDFFNILLTTSSSDINKSLEKGIELFEWLLNGLRTAKEVQNNQLLINQTIVALRLLRRLKSLTEDKKDLFDTEGLLIFVRQLASFYTMHFLGEPLEGMQVMGLLETRNLDFSTVHLLSVNEGIIPADKNRQSLLPFDIRKTYDLPTHHEKQAIYAFHFFHLLQNANEINLYYNTESDPLGGGEMSRFMLQIKYELTRINPNIQFTEELFTYKVPPQKHTREISIEKTPQVIEKLKKRLSDGLSPTSLSRFIRCPLQFYWQDVLKIDEDDMQESGIGLNQMGTVIHKTLELLYQPYLGSPLQKNELNEMQQRLESLLTQCFQEEFPGVILEEGRNKIAYTVSLQFISKLIDNEIHTVSNQLLVVSEQEQKLVASFEIEGTKIQLKGTIDRIDQLSQNHRIIDYKTGKVALKDINVSTFEDFLDPDKSKGLQLAVYTLLYLLNNPHVDKMPVAGIFSLRQSSKGLMEAMFPETSGKEEFILNMTETLHTICNELLDPLTPFVQTQEKDRCVNCPYLVICKRDKKRENSY